MREYYQPARRMQREPEATESGGSALYLMTAAVPVLSGTCCRGNAKGAPSVGPAARSSGKLGHRVLHQVPLDVLQYQVNGDGVLCSSRYLQPGAPLMRSHACAGLLGLLYCASSCTFGADPTTKPIAVAGAHVAKYDDIARILQHCKA